MLLSLNIWVMILFVLQEQHTCLDITLQIMSPTFFIIAIFRDTRAIIKKGFASSNGGKKNLAW